MRELVTLYFTASLVLPAAQCLSGVSVGWSFPPSLGPEPELHVPHRGHLHPSLVSVTGKSQGHAMDISPEKTFFLCSASRLQFSAEIKHLWSEDSASVPWAVLLLSSLIPFIALDRCSCISHPAWKPQHWGLRHSFLWSVQTSLSE